MTLAIEPAATGGYAGAPTRPDRGWSTRLAGLADAAAPDIRVRRARLPDIARLKELEDASFASDRMSRRAIRQAVSSGSQSVLVAVDEADRVVAAAVLRYSRCSCACRLYSIAVAADRRRGGLGSRLLAALEREAHRAHRREMRLEARAGDPAALRFYERHLYRRTGVRAGFYEDGGDAICFAKSLTSPSTRH